MTSRLAHRLVNKVVTASKEGFGIESPKRNVVGHGIDTDFFVPSPSHHNHIFTLLTVGRISPSKDYETVIKALPSVIEKTRMPLRYLIVGKPFPNTPRDEHYLAHLQRLVQDLDLNDVVVFEGAVPHHETPLYYQDCTIFINPSLTGSLDKTGLEAMACGKSFLTCNKSYLSLFNGYRDDLFFRPKDSEDLATKLTSLITRSSQERKSMGLSLRKVVVEQHDLRRLINELIKVFVDEAGK